MEARKVMLDSTFYNKLFELVSSIRSGWPWTLENRDNGQKNSLLDLTNYNKLLESMSEHQISTANKNQNAEKHRFFSHLNSQMLYLSCL